jgi:hypothetical protein
MEETFDAVKQVDELALVSTGIFNRLETTWVKQVTQGRHEGHGPKGELRSPQRLHLLVEMPESKH